MTTLREEVRRLAEEWERKAANYAVTDQQDRQWPYLDCAASLRGLLDRYPEPGPRPCGVCAWCEMGRPDQCLFVTWDGTLRKMAEGPPPAPEAEPRDVAAEFVQTLRDLHASPEVVAAAEESAQAFCRHWAAEDCHGWDITCPDCGANWKADGQGWRRPGSDR